MENRSVRVENITIENFKNVKKGSIDLENKRKDYKASIVGIYGQNGSGKTALIDALALLKLVLCGQQVPIKYADYINIDAESSKLSYQFKIKYDEGVFDVWYQFGIRQVIDDTALNMQEDASMLELRTEVFDEVLSYAFLSQNEKVRKGTLIDTRTNEVFIPRSKFAELVGADKSKMTDLLVTKKVVQTTSRSFIFSREMINTFRKNCHDEKYMAIIEGLMTFGNRELFVINTENTGLISMNALPLAFKYKENNADTVGNITLPLNAPAPIPEEALGVVNKVIDNMNIVLEQIVPGLTIGIKDLGAVVFKDAKPGKSIQIMSLKNG